jgi:glycerol-3-phosphate O-acyltransferase/dihydroxyacetone phosphate acyltransferase
MVNWKYDLFLYMMGNLVDLFFREVVPRGSWKVPQSGPVLFVAAPHANQVSLSAVPMQSFRLKSGTHFEIRLYSETDKPCLSRSSLMAWFF